MKNSNPESGYLTLMAMVVILAVSSVIAVGVVLVGIDSSRSSLALTQSSQARVAADACSEEALLQIQQNNAFTGTNTLTIGTASCTYTVTNTGGTTRSVTAIGTSGTIIRKLTANITALSPSIILSSWLENG